MDLLAETWTDDWPAAVRGALMGLLLSACYGLALGARHGIGAMLGGAVGVPLGFLAVAALGAPAFYIAAAHAGMELSPGALAARLGNALDTSGQVLAGLAPALTVVSVSADTDLGAAIFGVTGLAIGGLLGLRRLLHELPGSRGVQALLGAFSIFAAVLAGRVWWLVLPMLHGEVMR